MVTHGCVYQSYAEIFQLNYYYSSFITIKTVKINIHFYVKNGGRYNFLKY